MKTKLCLFVTLILGSLQVFPTEADSVPESDQERESTDDGVIIESNLRSYDGVTQATVRRSTSVSSIQLPSYVPPHIYYETTRPGDAVPFSGSGLEKNAAASESLYPSFLRNSRHYFPTSDVDRFRPITTTARAKFVEPSILGSGDFGILKGGTFYQDSDPPIRSYYKDFYGLGHKSHNGHQRPFAAPLIQKQRYPSDPSNPFSNFRDFADINVSNDAGQYSEYYVVYANKHSEEKPLKNKINHKSDKNVIRNIKDQLDIIDKEIKDEHKKHKLSKTKVKLFKSKNQFKFKSTFQSVSNSPADNDFMLALS
ncbi:uncharacterized protein LOC129749953 [Uranotaenia lowii]|uniref:uncharacterized protein LOC129749953 n=1 Tax=Uranotaenia lowii TaxID=190385 RepID=UPI0024783BBE|nr:uncharacterized protein LOC129749953 [Uranotaenia lowii]XP_055601091.1 uncharacterized protein LOC129749953 [Uranotaenia lowii]XP_055601098.1 uncharacterized protein LOC129749953 [Uranotaenia lowii]